MNSALPFFLIVGVGIALTAITVTIAAFRHAPDGYEDEHGFHVVLGCDGCEPAMADCAGPKAAHA